MVHPRPAAGSPVGQRAQLVFDFADGSREQVELLGGKGANLAEMTNLGLPVPPGFTITTEACRHYLDRGEEPQSLRVQVTMALRRLEDQLGRRLGDVQDPLLVSVRSGAKFSMPGMMETVLNVGLNDYSVKGLAEAAGDERFAWDSYRRLIQMFGRTVLDLPGALFEDELEAAKQRAGARTDVELPATALAALVESFKQIVAAHTGREFPQDPREQLDMAMRAVFESWNTDRARIYRRRERIPHDLGTAVNICAMVFGNLGETSGTGVCFTRDPATGKQGAYGDYLGNAQGEDVVAGIRNTLSLEDFARLDPASHAELTQVMRRLETHYRDLCDIEFTVENGKLWILQTRVGKRTAAAAFRIATQLIDERLITQDEALHRVTGEQLGQLLFPQFDVEAQRDMLTRGMAASPGAASGKLVFDSATAVEWAGRGEDVLLCRRETTPDDLAGMVAAAGVLTSRGGKTSHAAVVARGMGRTCVCGAEELDIDVEARTVQVNGTALTEGDVVSIDGTTGEVFAGRLPVVASPVVTYLEQGLDAALAAADPETAELVRAVDRLLRHADRTRRLRVRANADTAEDATRARDMGAEGIGLCRTEHMFLGERRVLIERLVLAEAAAEREAALAELLPLQRADFVALLAEMDGLPVTIRLLDPPLHEFLPDRTDLAVKVAVAEVRGEADPEAQRLLAAVERLHESNPMLGLRGVRLGLLVPGLYEMQVRAIAEAAAERADAGGTPVVEIMVPLVGSVMELHLIRDEIDTIITEVVGTRLEIPVGTMIELPRAALTARRVAEAAEFFSFGTNDLTQTVWGFSRDDVEASIFATYLEKGVFTVSPFESLDRDGVGALIRTAVAAGRETARRSSWASAGSTAATPSRSTSSTTRTWTTCPARPTGSRWPAWRQAAPPSPPPPASDPVRIGRVIINRPIQTRGWPMDKPAGMFDRDFEWAELTRFARYPGSEATLGVVSGRRRQGKTFLLDALARAGGGFMFTATETTEADALRQFGQALAAYCDEPVPFRFAHWDEAITRLMRIATDGPAIAVIDEFPFLARSSPALPSIIQRALDPAARATGSPVRLLLCGSALSFMGNLLSGNAPLRGRAGLELVVPTLDYRLAAEFWGITDPHTAALTHAIVGGTPAYRREFTQGDSPEGPDDFDDWVIRAVLNPARPLFREARYLLAEEPELHDTALFHSVLGAIAAGNSARGGIASYLGRKSTDLAHPLHVLEDVGLIRHEPDAFRQNRSAYRIAEPLVTFYHAVMRPSWGDLERPGRAARVWRRARRTFHSQVVGPHFEALCREWARWNSAPETYAGSPDRVAAGVVSDPSARTSHEVDVVVTGRDEDDHEVLLGLGEVKWNETMGLGHLRRLVGIRDLLAGRDARVTENTRILCFSGAGFMDELRRMAEADNTIQLVDLERLYHGE